MLNTCSKCGKKAGLFVKLDNNNICESCNIEILTENYKKEQFDYNENLQVQLEEVEASDKEEIPNKSLEQSIRKNSVAKIIKVFAIVNAVVTIIIAGVMAFPPDFYYSGSSILPFFQIAGVGIIASVFIYAFGEVIDLLQGIKNNTSK